jgi:arsenate reductase-like glutaredoxin family protein
MVIYGLKTCDTCRKARKSLPDAEFRDLREDGIEQDVLKAAFAQFGSTLLNTRSLTWRGLSEEERKEAPLTLLATHPSLMKRPLIDTGDRLCLGWASETRAALGVQP